MLVPPPVQRSAKIRQTELYAPWRHASSQRQRFQKQLSRWQSALPVTSEHPLLVRRLLGLADTELLARIDLRQDTDHRGEHLLLPLRHHQHGLAGFQQLFGQALDESGRTQNMTVAEPGHMVGSLICIRARKGFEHWPVGICEGFFTGLSVALAWPGPMAIAICAGNLKPVRKNIKRACVIFADKDA